MEPSLHTVPLSPTSLVAKKTGFKPVQESWGAGPSAPAGAPHIQAQSHSRATDGGAGASDPPAGADRGPSRSVTGPRAARRAGRGLQPASWLRLASERAMAGHEGRAIWGARQEGHWCGARGPALGWKRQAPEGLGGTRWHEALIQREGFFPGGAMDCDGPLGTVGCCGISHARPLRVSVPRASLGSQGGPGDGLEAGGFSGVGRGHRDSLSPWGRCREPFLSPILFPSVSRPPRSCPEMPGGAPVCCRLRCLSGRGGQRGALGGGPGPSSQVAGWGRPWQAVQTLARGPPRFLGP